MTKLRGRDATQHTVDDKMVLFAEDVDGSFSPVVDDVHNAGAVTPINILC